SWRRSGRPVERRGRYWQEPTYGHADGAHHPGATHAPALFLLSAAHGQRASSHHRTDQARRWLGARRGAEHHARQAGRGARENGDPGRGYGPVRGDAVHPERWALSYTRSRPPDTPATNARCSDRAGRAFGGSTTSVVDL